MSATVSLDFVKGHGTENDFVLIPDPDAHRPLTISQVQFLADRRAGIGGDGVIRVLPTAAGAEPAVVAQAGQARWFMDYRNADGSVSEMCGNGVRVFAAYLRERGWETADAFAVATRAGVKRVRFEGDLISVDMGTWRVGEPDALRERGFDTLVAIPDLDPLPALSLDVGNPHAVVALPDDVDLDVLDLTRPPVLNPIPEAGANVELVHTVAKGHLRMRVHERGVGETRSCGTGACAAALAVMLWSGDPSLAAGQWRVDVPGGRLGVRALPDHRVELSGPAALVAEGTVRLPVV